MALWLLATPARAEVQVLITMGLPVVLPPEPLPPVPVAPPVSTMSWLTWTTPVARTS